MLPLIIHGPFTTTCTWSSPKFLITYNLNGGANSGSSLNVHELKESGEFLNDGATLTNQDSSSLVGIPPLMAQAQITPLYPVQSLLRLPLEKTIFKATPYTPCGNPMHLPN